MNSKHLKSLKQSKLLNSIKETPRLVAKRKNDHIRICQTKNVESLGDPFDKITLLPEALPELDDSQINTSQSFLDKIFSLPLLVTGMTGGVQRGQEINEAIALAAQKYNIPMGLGSQKIMLQEPKYRKLFDVRKVAPQLFVIGNLGAVSFNYGVSVDDVRKLIDELQLGAFALHLNALQECIQPEGERNFSQLLNKIECLAKTLSVPLLVKEVGSGITARTFQKLVNCGVSAIDVGGKGGTSWGAIEGMRSDAQGQRLGELFRNWGLATDEALVACVKLKNECGYHLPLIATGGIRHGVQVAKAIALGATMVGIGLPLFRAASNPQPGFSPLESVEQELSFFQRSLSIAMFCSGAQSLSHLSARISHNPFYHI
jgi:isopentenyl-diphosphate delta-isomerase